MNVTTIFMFLVFLIVMGVGFFIMYKKLAKTKPDQPSVKVVPPEPPPFVRVNEVKKANVLLFQPREKGGIIYARMIEDKIPAGAQQHLVDWAGKWLYFLEKHDDKFTQYEPKEMVEQLPSTLLEAINMPANRKMWAMSHNPLEKLAMWAPVVVVGAGMILLFAMVN